MILEGLVTTTDEHGVVNIAPMGPIVTPAMDRLRLRPFRTSTTFQNLRRTGQGVFHVTDDVEMIARAAIGRLDVPPRLVPLSQFSQQSAVQGQVIADACRWYAFRVASIDESAERVEIDAEVVASGQLRDFFGFNRAKHAVVEAAILATRVGILPVEQIVAEMRRLAAPVQKTAGDAERRAFELLERHINAALSPTDCDRLVTITAPSRLHFGMFSFGHDQGRQFGGAGLMVDEPALRLTISPADRLSIDAGRCCDRIQDAICRAADSRLIPRDPQCHIRLVEIPPQHVGLGTGTQLALAVVRALLAFHSRPEKSAAEFAPLFGRGRRSAVGTHGFDLGGLIVESGKRDKDGVGTLAARVELPEVWRCVLAIPRIEQGLSGGGETAAFDTLPSVRPEVTAELCREALLSLVPAARAGDFDEFSESVYRFNRLAGSCYAPVQAGPYAEPFARKWVEKLRGWGVRCVGQSSWGPTVFAFTADGAQAEALACQIAADEDATALVTRPALTGATVQIGRAALPDRR